MGVHHKNVVARTACGRLLADVCRELGSEAIAKGTECDSIEKYQMYVCDDYYNKGLGGLIYNLYRFFNQQSSFRDTAKIRINRTVASL